MKRVLMLLGSYDPGAHRGIARAARESGWFLDVSLLKTFQIDRSWTGDGIVCSLNQNRRLERFVLGSGLPAVDLSLWRNDVRLPRVAADNDAIGRAAAEHLLSYGHRTFAWFALSRNPVGEGRRLGFGRHLNAAGHRVLRLDGGGPDRRTTVRRRLHALPKPCAVFCKSDDDAAWIESVCIEAGLRIPEEVAVIGVDNNA